MIADIAVLGASSLDPETNAIKWQASVPVANDVDDVEPLGELEVFQSLGLAARPFAKDENGNAEGVILRNCGGRSAICIGARDTRTAKVYGKLDQGDTCLHSTGPEQAAQCLLKEKKRQTVLASKDSKKRSMVFVLDGTNDKVQIAALGAMIEIDPSGDVSIANGGGASILLQGGDIYLNGTLHLPGVPPGAMLMASVVPGTPSTLGTPIALVPVMGVGK